MMTWKLDGTDLGEYRGLAPQTIKQLQFVTTVDEVPCFRAPSMPKGTLEVWDGKYRVAVISGTGGQNGRG